MRRFFAWAVTLAVGAALVLGLRMFLRSTTSAQARVKPHAAKSAKTPAPAPQPSVAAPSTPRAELSFIAIGGGASPQNTEVSLEQDLALAERVFRGPQLLLFAGGSATQSVRIIDDKPVADELLVRLGDLFAPHASHRNRFRAPSLAAQPASLENVEALLSAAFAHGKDPLVVYIAAHGQQGEHARDNSVVLWGGQDLSVARLAELHDAHPRPLRLVSASCYSGGFGELAFRAADLEKGPSKAPRCGLFAGTWDRETSGCDPNPDRRAQEGYSLHFLQALLRRDRNGAPLAEAAIDFDGDGAVSLLEAHAYASIAARSIDVPTTTSETQLRAVQTRSAVSDLRLVPEIAAVVRGLEARFSLNGQTAARARLETLSARLRELEERVDAADTTAQARFDELSARLLGRWPVLDDPYNPEFAPLVNKERETITKALDEWPEATRYDAAQDALDELDVEYGSVEVEEAELTRLVRAYETLALATGLRARGGRDWVRYQELLACERYVPAPSPGGT